MRTVASSRSQSLALAGVLLAAALVAGCGATEPSPSRSPDLGPDASAAATAAPTSNLADFEGRLRDATTREGVLVRALADASAGSAADLRLVVGQMRDWVEGEQAWLANHPIEPCYDAAGTKFEAALDAMAASADAFAALADAGPAASDDVTTPSLGAQGGQSLQDAARALADAAGLAKVARTECR
jgi:hypothetical protein